MSRKIDYNMKDFIVIRFNKEEIGKIDIQKRKKKNLLDKLAYNKITKTN